MKTGGSSAVTQHNLFGLYRIIAIFAWTALAIAIAIWECSDNKEFKTSNALATARACVEKDLVFRRWAAEHGGVYVPVTDKTPTNPWLKVPERDITTPSGRRLTLMNPAYMSRQIHEISRSSGSAPQGHITSLKSIRPENAPDPWEARALASFEAGQAEFGEFLVLDGKPVYRYMRPFTTEKACLKCHASQGYREGAVRGGISIAVPTAGLERAAFRSNVNHVAIIAAIWLMGLCGIGLGFRRIGAVAAALTAERDNLSSVFDATPMPMLLFDDRMEAVRVNSAFREYCIDYDVLPDKRCGTILKCANALSGPHGCGNSPACDSCRLTRALREVSRSGLPVRGEASVQRAGGGGDATEAWLLYGVEAVSLDGRTHALLSFMDITARKRMENELQNKNSELERFTYTVSHDLKSPLITIKSFSGSIKNDLASGRRDRIEKDLNRICSAADKMAALLDDLLKLSRVGHVINTPEPVDMAQLVNDVLKNMDGTLKENCIQVSVQPGLPTVQCDRQRMMEVVQNLIENAVKYRGDQPEPRILIGLREESGRQVFFVQDNGPGIEPKYHENIFGLFNRLNTRVPGTGIGLALVKRIIEVHGGSIWVESDGCGNGSTFCFTVK